MDYKYGIGRQISRQEATQDGIPFDELELFNSKTRLGDQKAVVAILKFLQATDKPVSWDALLKGATNDELFSDDERKTNLKFIRYNIILAMRNLEVAGFTKRIDESTFTLTTKGRDAALSTFDVWQDVYRISIVRLYHLRVSNDESEKLKYEVIFKFKIKNRDN